MTSAVILCSDCGAVSTTPLSLCGKCGGKNSRVCPGCGFPNSFAKNYCDKCGNPISDLGDPSTTLSALPRAKMSAAEPGAPHEPYSAEHPGSDPFAQSVSNDPWSVVKPTTPHTPAKAPILDSAGLRRALTGGFAIAAVIIALTIAAYWNEHGKPEDAVQRAAAQYLEALRVHDYDAAYSHFSGLARKHCTLDEFRLSRGTDNWTWSNLRVERAESGATLFAYELAAEGAPSRTDRVLFIEEGERWVRPYNWVLLRKAEEAFDANDADAGLIFAQNAALINSRDPMARGFLCEAAYYRKSPIDTERQCATALELSRAYPSMLPLSSLYHLHAILADTYKNALQKPELALDQFTQLLAFPNISPADQCQILLARSESYMTLSRPGEALADANRAAQLCSRRRDQAYTEEIRLKLNAPAL